MLSRITLGSHSGTIGTSKVHGKGIFLIIDTISDIRYRSLCSTGYPLLRLGPADRVLALHVNGAVLLVGHTP
jgi:hypothetical protein